MCRSKSTTHGNLLQRSIFSTAGSFGFACLKGKNSFFEATLRQTGERGRKKVQP